MNDERDRSKPSKKKKYKHLTDFKRFLCFHSKNKNVLTIFTTFVDSAKPQK